MIQFYKKLKVLAQEQLLLESGPRGLHSFTGQQGPRTLQNPRGPRTLTDFV